MSLIDTMARGGLFNTFGQTNMRNIIDITASLLGCIENTSHIEPYLNIIDTNIYRAYPLYQVVASDAFTA